MSRLRPTADQILRLWDQRAGNKPALVFPSGRGALRAFVDLHFFAQDVRQHGGTAIPSWEDRSSLQDP